MFGPVGRAGNPKLPVCRKRGGWKIAWEDMTMNIIKRLKRAAWLSFETFVDAIMERGLGVYGYPPASPEPVRALPAVKSA